MMFDLNKTANLPVTVYNNISTSMASLKRCIIEGNANGVNQSYKLFLC